MTKKVTKKMIADKFGTPKYSFNSLVELIDISGKTPEQMLMSGFNPVDMKFGLQLIWAGMLYDNPNLTISEVSDLLDKNSEMYVDVFVEFSTVIVNSFRKYFKLDDEVDEVVDGNTKN